jgi:hypothetical protein
MDITFILIVLGLGIVVGGVVLLLLQRPLQSFAVLLLLLPIHTGLFQVLSVELGLSPTLALLLQSWKEGLLLLLVCYLGLRMLGTGTLRMAHPWLVALIGLFLATGILALPRAPNWLMGLYAFRGTFEPFVILLLTLSLPLSLKWVEGLVPRLLVVAAIVAGFAIFQAVVLGYAYLWKYYAASGAIASSFSFMGGQIQRAMGTFASPNQLSLYLTFLIILAVNLTFRLHSSRWRFTGLIGLLLIALLLTVSRSGWLAALAGLGTSMLIWRRKQKLILVIAAMSIVSIPVVSAAGLDQHVLNTFHGSDPSAVSHLEQARENLQIIAEHPLGVGLGWVGSRAKRFPDLPESAQRYTTESYLLQTTMELGLPGLFVFALLVTLVGILIYTNIFRLSGAKSRAIAVSAFSCLIAALVHAIFIPDLQDIAVGSYLWFFVGLGLRLPALETSENVRAES